MRYISAKSLAKLKRTKRMTRRELRYEKRKAKRLTKRALFRQTYDNFNLMCNRDHLFCAGNLAKKHVMWKASVQRWSIHQLTMTERIYRNLKAGKDVRKGFSNFYIYERGKRRDISAVKFYERVAQKALCHYVLYPAFEHNLIYDNAASRKNKGTKFATDRLILFLRRYFKLYSANGYVLLMDFKSYFDNINHDVVKLITRKEIKDKRLIRYIDDFIDAYGNKGLGLGSETSQLHAIRYPNKIDHVITENSQDKVFYGRYMDDSYIIARNKAVLLAILKKVRYWCEKLKIILSPKKTKIVKLSDGIKWLQTKLYLTKTGKIIKKPCRKAIVRERRKLKKQLGLLESGAMTAAEIWQSFNSWTGSMKRRNARLTVWNMRCLLLKGIENAYEKIRNHKQNQCLQTGISTK